MSSQPPYGSFPGQSQPWPEQPPDPSYPGYQSSSAYPPPPPYGATPYQPTQGQPPAAPVPPVYGAPNIYVQPAPYPYVVAAPPDPGAGQAVAALVLGIVAIVCAIIPCLQLIGLVTGIVGLVLGIVSRKSVTRHGMAVTGIVLSSISIGLTVIITALWILLNVISLATYPS